MSILTPHPPMIQSELVRRLDRPLHDALNALTGTLEQAGEAVLSTREVVRLMGRAGLLNTLVPAPPSLSEVLSGAAGATEPAPVSSRALCFIRESLAYDSSLWDQAFALQGLASEAIVVASSLRSGSNAALSSATTDALAAISGGGAVASFALSEPDAGADLTQLSTTADRTPDGYRLHGTKSYVPHALEADAFIVFANAIDGEERRLSVFWVESSDLLRREEVDVLGGHPMGTLHFDGVLVPLENRLAEEGDGTLIANRVLLRYHTTAGAAACGLAARAFDEALQHIQRRQQFGVPVAHASMVHSKLATMARDYECARAMVYCAASTFDRASYGDAAEPKRAEGRARYEASLAKWTATEAAHGLSTGPFSFVGRGVLNKGPRWPNSTRRFARSAFLRAITTCTKTSSRKSCWGLGDVDGAWN